MFPVPVCEWCVRRSDLQANNYLLNAFQVSCSNSLPLAFRMYKKVKSKRRQIRKADVKLNDKVSTSSTGLQFDIHPGNYVTK